MHIYSKKAVVLLKSSDALQHGLKGFHLSQDFCRFHATRLHQEHVHDAHEASGPRKGPQPHRWDLQIFGRKQGLPLWQLVAGHGPGPTDLTDLTACEVENHRYVWWVNHW